MKKIFFVFAIFSLIFVARAAEISGFKVTVMTDKSNGETLISWTKISDQEILLNTDGYAIQWNENLSKITNQEPANRFVDHQKDNITILPSTVHIEKGKTYYFRIYTYKDFPAAERKPPVLTNGSKIFKFVLDKVGNQVKAEKDADNYLEPNDPVIVAPSSSSSGGEEIEKFRAITSQELDTSAILQWSNNNTLASSEFDGFIILVSDKNDFSNKLIEFVAGKGTTSFLAKGLAAATKYFSRGYFYKNTAGEKIKFGEGPILEFTTLAAFSEEKKRNIESMKTRKSGIGKILNELESKNLVVDISTGETTNISNSSSNNSSTNSTNNSTSSTSTNNSNSENAVSTPTDVDSIVNFFEKIDTKKIASISDANKILREIDILKNKLKNKIRTLK